MHAPDGAAAPPVVIHTERGQATELDVHRLGLEVGVPRRWTYARVGAPAATLAEGVLVPISPLPPGASLAEQVAAGVLSPPADEIVARMAAATADREQVDLLHHALQVSLARATLHHPNLDPRRRDLYRLGIEFIRGRLASISPAGGRR